MRFVVFGILDMRWKYRKMVKPQERLFMQSKRLHKESFLWNDLFHDKNKSEPIANRRKVRIYSLWWTKRDFIRTPGGSIAFYAVHKRGIQRDIHKILFPSDIKFELEVVVVEVHGHQECVEQFGLVALVLDIAVPI